MRNAEKEQIPLLIIERSPLFTGITVLLSAGLVYTAYKLLEAMNPWGFLLMIPAVIISFQTAWWLLNPFAHVFDNRVEMKQSLFHDKIRYFVDIQKTEFSKKGHLLLIYNDDDREVLNLFGIKPSHKQTLKAVFDKSVQDSIKSRS